MVNDISIAGPCDAEPDFAGPRMDFAGLLSLHQTKILRFIKSMIWDHHEAEDLLQRTNLILWQKRDAFEEGSSFAAWALSVARLETLNQIRQYHRDRKVFSSEPVKEAADQASALRNDDSCGDALAALNACMKLLPDRDRELLWTRYCTSRTLNEYARAINRSPGTLKARLFKLREDLRRGIETYLQEECRPLIRRD